MKKAKKGAHKYIKNWDKICWNLFFWSFNFSSLEDLESDLKKPRRYVNEDGMPFNCNEPKYEDLCLLAIILRI